MNIQLRDYQTNGIDEIMNAWADCKSVLFQMPTGTGKTTLFCEIARKFIAVLQPDKKVLIITHRKELVDQAHNRLVKDFHLAAGIISFKFFTKSLCSNSSGLNSNFSKKSRTPKRYIFTNNY
jgi:superfamily II DNA or RNA helicase